MATTTVVYAWTPDGVDTPMETAPNSVTTSIYSQNVELQNCRNSLRDTAQFFCGRFVRSRILILLVVFLLYALCGAFVFHLIEGPAELTKLNQTRNRMREKRNELKDRIAAIRETRDQDLKIWANLTYASLLWYENEFKDKVAPKVVDIDDSYLKRLLLVAASFSTIGFQIRGPLVTVARSAFVVLVIPGIFLYLSSANSIGKILHTFYNEPTRFCRARFRRRRQRDEVEHWRDQLDWTVLLPFIIALFGVSSAETAIFHYLSPRGTSYIDSAYCVTLAVFTIGVPKSVWNGISGTTVIHEQLVLSAFAFLWLSHLACLWHAVAKQREIFKRFLFAWLHKNKEDALFIKLSLLQPLGRRPALADKLMVKCAQGSFYRRLLFHALTLDDKVALCRHLMWKPDNRDRAVSRSAHSSPNGQGRYNAWVQVDMDRDVFL